MYSDYLKFSYLRKNCKYLFNRIYANYISKIENNINKNSKFFWKYIKLSSAINKVFRILWRWMVLLLIILRTPPSWMLQVANASYFSSVYSGIITFIHQQELTYSNYSLDLNLNSCVIFETEILDTFGSLSEALGPRPDGLLPIFLKYCLSVLIKPLHYLFNLSLPTGVVPYFLKKSFITSIFKSGDKSNVELQIYIQIITYPKAFEAIIIKKLSNLI